MQHLLIKQIKIENRGIKSQIWILANINISNTQHKLPISTLNTKQKFQTLLYIILIQIRKK
jgi:hypothetical protein